MSTPSLVTNVSLKQYNSFGLDVSCQFFYEAQEHEALIRDLPALQQMGLPLLILGGGSNVLLTQDFPGIVIKISFKGIHIHNETSDQVDITAAAGENWHQLVLHCLEHNLAGIENLSLIPGQVGAAPIQNIGAYGVEIKDCFLHLHAIHINSGTVKKFTHADCAFGYRDSVFKRQYKNQYIIRDVTLRLSKRAQVNLSYRGINEYLTQHHITQPSIRDVSNAIIAIRQQKLPDPAVIGNAGSFFKNPVISADHYQQLQQLYPDIPGYPNDTTTKIPAAWLIEHCGYKGKRIDQIGVHDKQALVLVNHGQGDGHAIAQLAETIQRDVANTFNISLETEVNII